MLSIFCLYRLTSLQGKYSASIFFRFIRLIAFKLLNYGEGAKRKNERTWTGTESYSQ